MEQIRSWVLSLAVCAIAGAVVLSLAPGGGLEKAIKTMVSVFLICSAVVPLFSSGINIDISSAEIEDSAIYDNSIAEKISSQTEEYIQKRIEELLSQNGISDAVINIQMKVSDDAISVESVIVGIDKKYSSRSREIKKLIKENLGIIADVTY